MDKKPQVLVLIAVTCILFCVSMWQIEEIWRSLQNGWAYNLPFKFYTYDYWTAHDVWFIVQGTAFVGAFICGYYFRKYFEKRFF